MTEQPRPYRTAARHYHARPPYSRELLAELSARLGWDGAGRLLDVGCGPGVIALQLAAGFREVIGLDPEPAMLEEAARSTPPGSRAKLQWILGRAEEIPELGLGFFRAVTLAQSFHWTDRQRVAEIVYEALEPKGSMLLIHHEAPSFGPGDPATVGTSAAPPHPPISHDVIDQALVRWLGHGKPPPDPDREPYSDLLARTRFQRVQRLVLPGRKDLVRTIDQVIDSYLSTSFAAPELFGMRLEEFRADLSEQLKGCTDTGFFWEWPGDTDVLIARKDPGAEQRT